MRRYNGTTRTMVSKPMNVKTFSKILFTRAGNERVIMQPQRNLIKGLADDEIQIIGIEFTITTPNGVRQELGMFSPQGLIIPRMRSNTHYTSGAYRPSITFHTTDGDYTLNEYGGACPW